MTTLLCLLRHGRATGQGSDAPLLPEGEAYVASLGRRLAGEGFKPAAAFSSPYLRARDTANILLGELGSSVPLAIVRKLQPESRPTDALEALFALGIPEGRVLVVSHLPLIGQLVHGFTGETVDFQPGTYVEIELDAEKLGGVLLRSIGPDDPVG
jgi:phosphohistidine phosphatase